MQIEIRNLQSLPIDETLLAAAAREALRVAEEDLDAVEIALVDDARITDLNRRFLGRDGATDVIAFEAEEEPERRAGQVIISVETAQRQAREIGHSLHAELCVLVAHGVLHVLGYEDYDEHSRGRMDRLQQQVLMTLEERLMNHG